MALVQHFSTFYQALFETSCSRDNSAKSLKVTSSSPQVWDNIAQSGTVLSLLKSARVKVSALRSLISLSWKFEYGHWCKRLSGPNCQGRLCIYSLAVVAVHSSPVDQVAMTRFRKDQAARSSYDLEVEEAIGNSRNVAANYSFDPYRATIASTHRCAKLRTCYAHPRSLLFYLKYTKRTDRGSVKKRLKRKRVIEERDFYPFAC